MNPSYVKQNKLNVIYCDSKGGLMTIARISPFPIRMPEDLRGWYEREARDNGRSLNSELVRILSETRNRKEGARKKCRS